MLTRKQFFARMRKMGFSKSQMQMTRTALTYRNDDGVTVTVPKHHEKTFHIFGDVPFKGIFVEDSGNTARWGIPVNPSDLGLNNMLEVCLGLCAGDISFGPEPEG